MTNLDRLYPYAWIGFGTRFCVQDELYTLYADDGFGNLIELGGLQMENLEYLCFGMYF